MTDMLDKVSVHDAQGVIADLMQKLGGDDGQAWLKSAKRFLRKENPFSTPDYFEDWMVGALPEGGSVVGIWESFLTMIPLHGTGIPTFDLDDGLLSKLQEANFSTSILPGNSLFRWVRCKVSDLGFETESENYNEGDAVPTEVLLARAEEFGLLPVRDFQILQMMKTFQLYKGDEYVFPGETSNSRLVALYGRPGQKRSLQTLMDFPAESYPGKAVVIFQRR